MHVVDLICTRSSCPPLSIPTAQLAESPYGFTTFNPNCRARAIKQSSAYSPCSLQVRNPAPALTPDASNQMFGRTAFLIHGDSVVEPGTASRGCIIMSRGIRNEVAPSGDHVLTV